MKKCMETNGKNRFASQGVSIAQMMYVSKYKSHKIALFNSMKKSNIAPISDWLKNIFIDPIVSARKKAEKRDRHEERERKKERDISASTPSWLMMALTPKRLFLSFSLSSCLSLFSAFFLALTIGSINIFWKCVWAPKSCFQPWRTDWRKLIAV